MISRITTVFPILAKCGQAACLRSKYEAKLYSAIFREGNFNYNIFNV